MAYGGYGNNGGGNPFILGGGNANNYNQPPANPFDQDPAPVDYSDNTLGGFYDDEPADTQYETVNVYDDDLQFQDYSLTGSDSQYDVADSHATPAKLADTLNLPEPSGYTSSDDLNLVAGGYKADANKIRRERAKSEDSGKYSFYQIGYYKSWFDFDTVEIKDRLLLAINPLVNKEFWDQVKEAPDLYVAFWGPTTLWFLISACVNIAAYLANDASNSQYAKVAYAAFAVYGYCLFLPLIWWLCFKFWIEIPLSYADNACLYGYSVLPYLPAAIICIMPFPMFRWIPILLALGLSVWFQWWNYFGYLKHYSKQGFIVLGLMIAFNAGLALAFKFYFFAYDTYGEESN